MPRNIYSATHEDFRASVQEFVERTLRPRTEQMLEVKSIDRDLWKEAGAQGLFGLDIPEEFGGMGAEDYRFNAVAAEVISGFNAAVGSCFGIHSDVCP
ncbi:MAG: acyl-CoA dehydrogenase family protein, partial [Phycicoccus sp.]